MDKHTDNEQSPVLARICAMQGLMKKELLIADNDNHARVEFTERCDLGYLNLRLAAQHDELTQWLGCELPAVGQVMSAQRLVLIGLGPSEWLLLVDYEELSATISKISTLLTKAHHLLADVSGGTTTLEMVGEAVEQTLEKGTYVDLHENVFLPQSSYATQLAGAPVIIVKNARSHFSVIVRRSFADHVLHWLLDAAKPFGYRIV